MDKFIPSSKYSPTIYLNGRIYTKFCFGSRELGYLQQGLGTADPVIYHCHLSARSAWQKKQFSIWKSPSFSTTKKSPSFWSSTKSNVKIQCLPWFLLVAKVRKLTFCFNNIWLKEKSELWSGRTDKEICLSRASTPLRVQICLFQVIVLRIHWINHNFSPPFGEYCYPPWN